MTQIITVIIALAIIAHLIRPLGLPGLRRRADAWKLVIFAFVLFAAIIFLRPEPADELPPGERPAVALPDPARSA